jgi:hypothetical protein
MDGQKSKRVLNNNAPTTLRHVCEVFEARLSFLHKPLGQYLVTYFGARH